MFKEMRRQDRRMEAEEAEQLLLSGEYGVLSTVGADEYAYGVPLHYVFMDGGIYFHCALTGHKLDNIAWCDKVSFCVVGQVETLPSQFSTRYRSVTAFGRAARVYDEEKARALLALIEKYSADFVPQGREYIRQAEGRTAVVKITVEHITGKARR